MFRSDPDSSAAGFAQIQNLALKTLKKGDAIGVYPTPITHLIEVAKLEVVENEGIDESYLARLSKRFKQTLKSAVGKLFAVFDYLGKIIHVEKNVHVAKRPFLKLHELGHAVIPWQRDIYTGIQESENTLQPEISEEFERQANVFATEVLFQIDAFDKLAASEDISINVPLRLKQKFGSSAYAAVRRYVSRNCRSCAVLILEPTEMIQGDGFKAKTRRIITSERFDMTFGLIRWPESINPDSLFGRFIPLGNKKMCCRDVVLIRGLDGKEKECLVESFKTPYQTFILIIEGD